MKMRSFQLVLLVFMALPLVGQNMLLLKKNGKLKYYKYQAGQKISLETDRGKTSGIITHIGDTIIEINYFNRMNLNEIKVVYRNRPLFQRFTRGWWKAGIVYAAIIIARPEMRSENALLGAGMLVLHFVFEKLQIRPFETGKKWKLEVLNFESLNNAPI